MTTDLLLELSGWLGTAAFLLAYALISMGRLAGDGVAYQALNLAGGVLMLINSFYHAAMPSVAVNAFWIAIALFTLGRVRLRRNASAATTAAPHADDTD